MADAVTRALAERVGRLLAARSLSVAVAESCTGGLLCAALTDVPGSSAYFRGGIVAYDNAIKTAELGVPVELLGREGAVSEPVAAAMADGVARRLAANVGVGTTGIAGPGGGSPGKPVGTVWIAVAAGPVRISRRFAVPGDRDAVRAGAVERALRMLLEALEAGGGGDRG